MADGTAGRSVGRLEAIWLKRARGGPMDPVQRARALEGKGLEGNANQGGWRQVTLIEREVFDGLRSEGLEVDPAMRRANLMVSGIRLEESRGRVLRIGDCRIRVRGETRPCRLMDETVNGLRGALRPDWNGGAFGVVEQGGEVEVGAPVLWEDVPESAERRERQVALWGPDPFAAMTARADTHESREEGR